MKDMEIEKPLPDIVCSTKPQKKAKRQSEATGDGEPKLPKVDNSINSVKKSASPDVDTSMNTTCPDVTDNAKTNCPATEVVVESKEKKLPTKPKKVPKYVHVVTIN